MKRNYEYNVFSVFEKSSKSLFDNPSQPVLTEEKEQKDVDVKNAFSNEETDELLLQLPNTKNLHMVIWKSIWNCMSEMHDFGSKKIATHLREFEKVPSHYNVFEDDVINQNVKLNDLLDYFTKRKIGTETPLLFVLYDPTAPPFIKSFQKAWSVYCSIIKEALMRHLRSTANIDKDFSKYIQNINLHNIFSTDKQKNFLWKKATENSTFQQNPVTMDWLSKLGYNPMASFEYQLDNYNQQKLQKQIKINRHTRLSNYNFHQKDEFLNITTMGHLITDIFAVNKIRPENKQWLLPKLKKQQAWISQMHQRFLCITHDMFLSSQVVSLIQTAQSVKENISKVEDEVNCHQTNTLPVYTTDKLYKMIEAFCNELKDRIKKKCINKTSILSALTASMEEVKSKSNDQIKNILSELYSQASDKSLEMEDQLDYVQFRVRQHMIVYIQKLTEFVQNQTDTVNRAKRLFLDKSKWEHVQKFEMETIKNTVFTEKDALEKYNPLIEVRDNLDNLISDHLQHLLSDITDNLHDEYVKLEAVNHNETPEIIDNRKNIFKSCQLQDTSDYLLFIHQQIYNRVEGLRELSTETLKLQTENIITSIIDEFREKPFHSELTNKINEIEERMEEQALAVFNDSKKQVLALVYHVTDVLENFENNCFEYAQHSMFTNEASPFSSNEKNRAKDLQNRKQSYERILTMFIKDANNNLFTHYLAREFYFLKDYYKNKKAQDKQKTTIQNDIVLYASDYNGLTKHFDFVLSQQQRKKTAKDWPFNIKGSCCKIIQDVFCQVINLCLSHLTSCNEKSKKMKTISMDELNECIVSICCINILDGFFYCLED